jgi:ABC-type uncharacterized transport system ATPase subunit
MKLQFNLYARPRCGLCDLLHEDLLALCRGMAVDVLLVDVDSDPDLSALYGTRIPVLVGEGAVLCEGHLDPTAVRAFLDQRRAAMGVV